MQKKYFLFLVSLFMGIQTFCLDLDVHSQVLFAVREILQERRYKQTMFNERALNIAYQRRADRYKNCTLEEFSRKCHNRTTVHGMTTEEEFQEANESIRSKAISAGFIFQESYIAHPKTYEELYNNAVTEMELFVRDFL